MIVPLYQRIPGPGWLKAIFALAVAAVAIWALVEFAFPVIDRELFPVDDAVVGEQAANQLARGMALAA